MDLKQFSDYLSKRIHEDEHFSRLKDNCITGSYIDFNQYKYSTGQLTGMYKCIQLIEKITLEYLEPERISKSFPIEY